MPPHGPEGRRGGWTLLSARAVYDNPWISVTEHQVRNPKGGPGIYGVVHMKSLAIGIVPIDAQGRTVLVGQHRFPLDAYSWEIPEGGGALDVAPEVSALRELREETGLIAGRIAEIQRITLSNAVTDERGLLYLAWDLTEGPALPEDTEDLALRRLPFRAALELAFAGEIADVMSLAALFKLDLMHRRGTLPDGFDPALLDP